MSRIEDIIRRHQARAAVPGQVDHIALGKDFCDEVWRERADKSVEDFIYQELLRSCRNTITEWHRAVKPIHTVRSQAQGQGQRRRRSQQTRNYAVPLRDPETLQLQGRRHESWYNFNWPQWDLRKAEWAAEADTSDRHMAIVKVVERARGAHPEAQTPGEALRLDGQDLDNLDLSG